MKIFAQLIYFTYFCSKIVRNLININMAAYVPPKKRVFGGKEYSLASAGRHGSPKSHALSVAANLKKTNGYRYRRLVKKGNDYYVYVRK